MNNVNLVGGLSIRKLPVFNPTLWRIRNLPYVAKGYIPYIIMKTLSRWLCVPVILSELRIVAKLKGKSYDLGAVSYRVVTNAGVAYIVDDWDGGANVIDNFNYHGCGTGTNAEDVTDTALQSECTTVLNPDNTRATGTKSKPQSNQMRTVGTLTFDGSAAVTEHGIFTQSATGGGTLLDRSVFSAINVGNGDSIQFTYTLTLSAGG